MSDPALRGSPSAPTQWHSSAEQRSTARLFRRVRTLGDRQAEALLLQQFMPLAQGLARRYYSRQEPLEDLVQVASLGLLYAIRRYDERRGTPFDRFAVPTIMGELKKYFRDSVWATHVPRRMKDLALAISQLQREPETMGRPLTVDELGQHLGLTDADAREGFAAYLSFYARSLDEPPFDGGPDAPRTRLDTLGSLDERYGLIEDWLTVMAAVRVLSPDDRRVLRMRLVEQCTQKAIAAQLSVSQMQVSRILRRIIDDLRRTIDGEVDGSPREPGQGETKRRSTEARWWSTQETAARTVQGRTREQLYSEARRLGVRGRSRMNKAQLQRAVDRRS